MINCAYCKSDIEPDSLFCDQCGKEVLICPKCGKTGKGKNCVYDGAKLISVEKKNDGSEPSKFPSISFSDQTHSVEKSPPAPISQVVPELRIINHNLKINIAIKDGDIIGRTVGDYASIFAQYKQVSGKHLQFIYDVTKGWMVKDLGSTWGTSYSMKNDWKLANAKLASNHPVSLSNHGYLLIANIEFQVRIENTPNYTPSGTLRP